MNSFDIVILIIVGIFCIKGVFRGMMLEVFTFVGLIVGYILALKFMSTGAIWLNELVKVPPVLANVISFAVIFLAVLITARIVASLLKNFLDLTSLGWMDRLGGLVVGLAKGLFVASLAVLIISFIPFPESWEKREEEALLVKPVGVVAPAVFNGIQTFFPKTKDFYEEIKEGFKGKSREMVDKAISDRMKDIKDIKLDNMDLDKIKKQVEEGVRE